MNKARRQSLWVTLLLVGPISITFISVSVSKLLDPAKFAQAISSYELAPEGLVVPLALYLPWLELLAGSAILWQRWRVSASVILLLLLLGLSAVLLIAWNDGNVGDCGCMAFVAMSIPVALARNLVLALMLIASIVLRANSHVEPRALQ